MEFIKFVDKAQQKLDNMEAQMEYIKELYDIMSEYAIVIDPNDMANYLVMIISLIFVLYFFFACVMHARFFFSRAGYQCLLYFVKTGSRELFGREN